MLKNNKLVENKMWRTEKSKLSVLEDILHTSCNNSHARCYLAVVCPQIGVYAAQMVMELIRDNRKILDRISHAHIDTFVGFLQREKVSDL